MARPKKLEDAAVAAFLAHHTGWKRDGDVLVRTYEFKGYPATIAFVVEVGFAAEKKDHHPDLVVTWGKVEVRWSTHDAGGLTELDLELASRCDELARQG